MLNVQIPFLITAAGSLNAFILLLYFLLFVKKKQVSQYLVLSLLLMFCIRTGVSSIYYFNKSLSFHFVQLGLSANFMIGPILYTYCKWMYQESSKKYWQHLWVNLFCIVAFGLVYRFVDHPHIWDHKIRFVIHFQLTCYLMACGILLWPSLKKLNHRPVKISSTDVKTLAVFGVSLIICLAFAISLYTSYVIGPLFYSILFYGLFIYAITHPKQIKQWFNPPIKYANKKIEEEEAKRLLKALNQLMTKEKPFCQTNLKLEQLASQLNITSNRLSQLLNDNLQLKFSDYINGLRVDEAKVLLFEKPHLTIEAIGYEVGFNSKSSFFSCFKKHTGLTPSAFKKTHKN